MINEKEIKEVRKWRRLRSNKVMNRVMIRMGEMLRMYVKDGISIDDMFYYEVFVDEIINDFIERYKDSEVLNECYNKVDKREFIELVMRIERNIVKYGEGYNSEYFHEIEVKEVFKDDYDIDISDERMVELVKEYRELNNIK